ncbi:MAG: putative toluene tolerance protein [Gallionellaceae bacterium]|nr:MAG: putative toluene tolerance protein [Gallionellaceae bacterium]
MKRNIALWLVAVLAMLSMQVRADVAEPDVLIKDTVRDVLSIVRQDKDIQAGNQKKILELVDAKVLPHFNFTRMTQLAVGKHWRSASPEQKQALVAEFRNLLVRTYTKAFTVYRDQTVEVKPFKMAANATEVTVKTLILKPGEPDIPVNYDMEKTADGWKAFDLTIEGVSLVSNYRSTFSDQIQQSGIDGLIKTLLEKNQAASTAPLRKAESK